MDKIKQHIKKIYDSSAESYGQAYKSKAGRFFMNKKLRTTYRLSNLNKEDKVLEIGCADGCYTFEFAKKGCNITGLDLSEEIIKTANRYNKSRSIKFKVGDVEKLPFDDESFDKIISFSALRYLPSLDKAFSEIHRVTRKGGVIIIDFPNMLNPWFNYLKPLITGGTHPHDHSYTTHFIERKLRKHGFKHIKTKTILFTPKIVPNNLSFLFEITDNLLEKLPLINRLGAIIMVKGVKR
tara:strand:+ start:2000 stop:2713 length:714 start_codon:yes stop_codon:yes gene_type:complete